MSRSNNLIEQMALRLEALTADDSIAQPVREVIAQACIELSACNDAVAHAVLFMEDVASTKCLLANPEIHLGKRELIIERSRLRRYASKLRQMLVDDLLGDNLKTYTKDPARPVRYRVRTGDSEVFIEAVLHLELDDVAVDAMRQMLIQGKMLGHFLEVCLMEGDVVAKGPLYLSTEVQLARYAQKRAEGGDL